MIISYNPVFGFVDQILNDFLFENNYDFSTLSFKDFLDFKGNTTTTNFEKIQNSITDTTKLINNTNNYNSGDYAAILVPLGVSLLMPNNSLTRDFSQYVGDLTTKQFSLGSNNYKTFIPQRLHDLVFNTKYVSSKIKSQINDPNIGGEVVINEFTVLMWVRAMEPAYQSVNYQSSQSVGTWINVTSFVESIVMSSTGEGATFNLTMRPVTCVPRKNGWYFGDVASAGNDNLTSSSILKTQLDQDKNLVYKTNDFFFHTVVQKNDLVMIKLEKLELESQRPINIEINSSDIQGYLSKVYDLIGLVDTTSINTSPGNVSVTVTGRDLTKVFIEENSVFFPEAFATNIFANEGILSRRLILQSDLQIVGYANYQLKTIETILKFIFNKYSNIGYIPDEVFNVYGSRAIKDKYPLQGTSVLVSDKSQALLDEKRTGIWQIMELVIDSDLADRLLVDNNLTADQGSILNGINKICQMPFVQFYTDTYDDKFYLVVRKPPFDKNGYLGLVYNNLKTTSSIPTTDNSNEQPTTETDTTSTTNVNDSLVIDIDGENVLGDNLVYHDEIYTWFRLVPQGLLTGLPDLAKFIYVPIIPLDTYAEVWGSRPLSIEYNYCPANYVIDKNISTKLSYAELQTFKDLQFVVQSYQYLPFARKGSISINGDRRIKKGTFIRYKLTGEIFYVESVSHERSIKNNKVESRTTINVSRGLVEKYLKGIDIEFNGVNKTVSYFNIVNTEIPPDADVNNKGFLRNWVADKDLFNFFLQRRQWE